MDHGEVPVEPPETPTLSPTKSGLSLENPHWYLNLESGISEREETGGLFAQATSEIHLDIFT